MLESAAIPRRTRLHLLPAFLGLLMASASAFEIDVIPSNPQVGQSVYFNVTGITEGLRYSEWYKGAGIPTENQIIRYNNGDNTINRGKQFFQGVEIYSTGSLLISNVTKDMEGPYTVSIQSFSQLSDKTVKLTVNDPGIPGSDSGLSSGAIAGICVGVFVFVTVAVGVVIYLCKPKDSGPL